MVFLYVEDYEVRQTMNRTQKAAFNIEIKTKVKDNELTFYTRVQNTSELVGHEVSAVALFPAQLARARSSYFQYEELVGLTYVKVSSDEFLQTFGPLTSRSFHFPTNALVIPSPNENFGCEAFVRVYDQFGRAAEAEFCVTLFPDPGKVYDLKMRRREEIYA